MKHRRIVLILFLALLLVKGASAAQGAPSQTTNAPALTNAAAASTRWVSERVDRATPGAGDARGQHPSVVTARGGTYVSYYDATNHDLKLAQFPAGSVGNCGPSNSWYCWTVDSGGDVGQYSSLAVDTHASGLRLGIAYFDATNAALKYANFACGLVCATTIYTIVSPGVPALVGRYASLKFDSTGNAHIAYQVYSTNSLVGYAHQVSSGGNCGKDAAAGKWQCDVVATGGAGTGRYTSLALSTYDDPRIAYYDADNGDLRIAIFLFAGAGTGNCYNTDWWCGRVNFVGDVGRFVSMQIDQANNMHIAYYDATNGKLRYAHWVSVGNCGDTFLGNAVWQCDMIDDMGTGLTQAGISLAVDANGYPNIVYQDASDPMGPAALKIARPSDVVGQPVGNCGPSGGSFLTWQCDWLDGGGSYLDEGDFASITFNSAGLANVVYYETDTYYDTGYLKVLRQVLLLSLPLVKR